MPLRLGPEIQALLRCALTGGWAGTERPRPGVAGRRRRREIVVGGIRTRAMCHPRIAKRYSLMAGGQWMKETELVDLPADPHGA